MFPSESHPIVNAFTAALKNNGDSKHKDTKSAHLQKVITTLGWRNRHSQADQYPMELNLPRENNRSVTFHVKQIQRGEIDRTFGTGATVWPASIVLVKYLEVICHLMPEKKNMIIGDLGSGTGITSIAAGLLFPNSYIFCTDGEDPVVDLAFKNVCSAGKELDLFDGDSNQLSNDVIHIGSSLIHVSKYWWGDGSILQNMNRIVANDDGFDIILCSDCLLPKLYPIDPLVEALDECISSKTIAYITYEHRYYPNYDPKEYFINCCRSKRLSVRTVPLKEQHHIYSVDDIDVLEIKRH